MTLPNTWSWILLILCFGHNADCIEKDCLDDYYFVENGATIIPTEDESAVKTVYQATSKNAPFETMIAIKPEKTDSDDIKEEQRFMVRLESKIRQIDQHDDDNNCNTPQRPKHCNFVKQFGTCLMPSGKRSLKMEYLPTILFDVIFLPTFTIDAPKFLTHAFHLIQALETLQDIAGVHGDLHPGNIGFGMDGAIKVFDFDRSYWMATTNIDDMTCAIGYSAPEVLLLEQISDRSKADTWSVGVTIYEMFVGEKFILDKLLDEYEKCERRNGKVWGENQYECSARAYYYASRVNRCDKSDKRCANVYKTAEKNRADMCNPKQKCEPTKARLTESACGKKMELLESDEHGRIKQAGVDAEQLRDLLEGLLRFDYTERMEPKAARLHTLFKHFA